MKFKDYYANLGLERGASEADIKKAYRKLAHKYHPDVSKEGGAEERFKDIAEAYQTLKDPEKRAAYDQLGAHAPGEEIHPSPDWHPGHSSSDESVEGLDLAELLARLGAGRRRAPGAGSKLSVPGEDYEVRASINVEQAYQGALLEMSVSMPDFDESGRLVRVPRTLKVRVPKGATDGQRLRLPGQGGRGFNGGRNGDLYLTITLAPHRLYRVTGHDLYLDLPLAPWEAALGASVAIPTPGGTVRMKIPADTVAGRSLRLAGRGLPRPHGAAGDLYAVVKIVMPSNLSERERELLKDLGAASEFDPRAGMIQEHANES